ncbi:hypothetical protein [Burkholderia lata]|uniref:hypothetical protein n=1 Tax=Burkholderia lata (strain ATCC 17760 / DSM 23089 / LMG 22485 / NCIMB 9086 / R18194 / 383) TaxID=482957 RepID=UPI0015826D66|nr:hypothetical protein [Burkholderia lata]
MPTPDWGVIQQVHAAWVQAVGSIGAILVAVIVPTAFWASDRRRARQAEEKRLKAIGAVTQLAFVALQRLHSEMTPTNLPGTNAVSVESLHDVQIAADAVDSIRIEALGSATLVANVTTVKRCIGRVRGLIPEVLPPWGTVLIVPIDFGALVRDLDAAQSAIEKEVSSSAS